MLVMPGVGTNRAEKSTLFVSFIRAYLWVIFASDL